MSFSFRSSNDQSLTYMSMIVYGQSGSGKTTLAATSPNPVVLNAEAGTMSLMNYDIPIVDAPRTADGYRQFINWFAQNRGDRETLIIDSLSEIAQVVLADEMSKTTNGQRAYGQMADFVLWFIRELKHQPYHKIFICKEDKVKDENTGGFKYAPMIDGQKGKLELPYQVDAVARLCVIKQPDENGVIQTHRWLQFGGDMRQEGKERTQGVLQDQEPADITYILNKVFNNKYAQQ